MSEQGSILHRIVLNSDTFLTISVFDGIYYMYDSQSLAWYIRRAVPAEAPLLTALSFRSKQHWGYDATFMQASSADLTLVPAYIVSNPVYVLVEFDQVVGYYSLFDAGNSVVELAHLFVLPEQIGRGYGQKLWLHAIRQARTLGFRRLQLGADPHAEGFYLRMGAQRIGEVPSIAASVMPGRVLPLLEISLEHELF